MKSIVSRPIRSASSSGPIGWFRPSFAPVSMSSGVPSPSCSAKHASPSIGMRIRFTMKPGTSFVTMHVLPIFSATPLVASKVSLVVCTARTISMSFISGGGFMKCMPMTRSGRFTAPASLVSEIDDVLLARMASGFIASSHIRKSFNLSSVFSVAASTTRSQSRKSAAPATASIRVMIAASMSALTFPLATCFSRIASTLPRPFSASSREESASFTAYPAWAATCAMPPPSAPRPECRWCESRHDPRRARPT